MIEDCEDQEGDLLNLLNMKDADEPSRATLIPTTTAKSKSPRENYGRATGGEQDSLQKTSIDRRGVMLRTYLFKSFQDGQDQRIKDTRKDRAIRIDDKDLGIRPDRYRYFTRIWLNVPDTHEGSMVLELHYCPTNRTIKELIRRHGGEIECHSPQPENTTVRVSLHLQDISFIEELANELYRMVSDDRDDTYPIPNWAFVCPRTAASLEKLYHTLSEFQLLDRNNNRLSS